MRKLFRYEAIDKGHNSGAFFVDSVSGWFNVGKNKVAVIAGGEAHAISLHAFTILLLKLDTYEVADGR